MTTTSTPDHTLSSPAVQHAVADLHEAARIMQAWARTLGRDNGNGQRQADIDWMVERAKRYGATAQALACYAERQS